MANHKSASKRNRQRIVRTGRARAFRTRVRGVLKAATQAIAKAAAGEPLPENTAELVKSATRLLDQAASKNAMPVKRAARLKGRLAAKYHAVSNKG